MIEIVLPHHLATDYGDDVLAAGGGAVRLLALSGGARDDPDARSAEIVVNGLWDGPATFRELLAELPSLRWIHTASSGLDDFASPALRASGVVVTNSAGLFSPALAEYAIAAMVSLGRHLPLWSELQRARRWGEVWTVQPEPFELRGRRLGIVGYGHIGRYLAGACRQLGMEVWATKRVLIPTIGEPLDRLLTAHELPELLGACDVVVLAASLNATSRRLLGRDEIAAMRRGAVLVNIARGALVDEEALVDALRSGHLRGAAVDVTTTEPLPAESPLWDAPNLLVTPHIGGYTPDSWHRTMDLFCANLRQYVAGRPAAMANVVDLDLHL